MSKLFVVVGGAYGSEGKGAVAGRICKDSTQFGRGVVNVRVGGPNAGHTVLGLCPRDCPMGVEHRAGRSPAHPWRLRQVPVAAVTNPTAVLVIAAGSEIDPDVLEAELFELDSAGYQARARLYVDRSATVLTRAHIDAEKDRGLGERLGSTAKGIGAARSDRIWREAQTWGDFVGDVYSTDTATLLADSLVDSRTVVIEGTQGYGLGLHTEHYPFTTSGDCRAIDFLSQAGISPWGSHVETRVVVCLRPYPIRVSGNSGPMKDETDWDALGLPVEHTTVTQKVRRVGGWDPELAKAAVLANGGPRAGVVWVALTMMDSVEPELAGADIWRLGWRADTLPKSAAEHLHSIGLDSRHLGYVGTGPDTALVNERMYH